MDGVRKKPHKNHNALRSSASFSHRKASKEKIIIRENDSLPSHEKEFRKKSKFRYVISIILIVLGLLIIISGGVVVWRLHSVSKNISFKSETSFGNEVREIAASVLPIQKKPLLGEDEGRINILLLGAAGQDKPGKYLTDTIMMASINTQTGKIGMLSLPRDLYVKIPDSHSFTKINSVYQIGLQEDMRANLIIKTVEDVTSLPIHYYVVADFDGFIKVVDALGGIHVNVERDIYDPRYPGPNYSYETFELSKGYQLLDGSTALKYVRERHNDPEGDFGRAKRQQKTLQAIKSKAFSMKTFLNPIKLNNLLNALENNIKTNISFSEIQSFIELSEKLDTQNITNKVVDAWKKDSLLKVSHVFYGDIRAFILVPKTGNYNEIHELAQNIFRYHEIEKRKDSIFKENAKIVIINESGDSSLPRKVKDVLADRLNVKNVTFENSLSAVKRNNSEVIDISNIKIFTLDEIIKKLSMKQVAKNLKYDFKKQYDIAIILGADLSQQFKYEEDSMEDLENASDQQLYLHSNIVP